MLARRRVLPVVVWLLLGANVLALWLARGEYVNGWDLFGATFGLLKLHEGSLADGVAGIARSVLAQRGRPVFTGGESLIFGLVPGLLNLVHPWLLWAHLVNLVLLVLVSTWVGHVLGVRLHVYWACILASPALTSQAIVGLPDEISNALSYGPALVWVLTERRRRRPVIAGALLDGLVFAGITAVALNGYESGKTFFVVPAVAALTLRSVSLGRRLSWVACAAAVAWFVHSQGPGTMIAALAAVPHEPIAFARGVSRLLRAYLVDWYIDFPALLGAALVGLVVLDRDRGFFAGLFLVTVGLVSLNTFQLDGVFLVPHRFLLLGFVSALVVTCVLSGAVPRPAAVAMSVLLALGAAYTTFSTVRFVTAAPYDLGDRTSDLVYPLPYNWARADAHILPGRIHDAGTLVRLVRDGTEPHVIFYGFSLPGEDTVNPQLVPARVLLQLGWETFAARVRFVDHERSLFFPFPIRPLGDVPALLAALPTPFYIHVAQPGYSLPSLAARYLNASETTAVDVGLSSFRSLRVDRFVEAGPMPLPSGPVVQPREPPERDGLCLTLLTDVPATPLLWVGPLPTSVPALVAEASARDGESAGGAGRRRRVGAVDELVEGRTALYVTGSIDNDGRAPRGVRFQVRAGHEVALLANGLVAIEALGRNDEATHVQEVGLPHGRTEIALFARRFWGRGRIQFQATTLDGGPITWRTRDSCG